MTCYFEAKVFLKLKKTMRFFFISLGRMVVTSPKIVINLPGTYEKLTRLVQRLVRSFDTNIQTHKQTDRHPVTLV